MVSYYSNQKTRVGRVNGKATEIGFWSSSRSTSGCLAQAHKEAHKNGDHLLGRDVSSQLSCPGLSYIVIFAASRWQNSQISFGSSSPFNLADRDMRWDPKNGVTILGTTTSQSRASNASLWRLRTQVTLVNYVCQDIAQFCMSRHCTAFV